MGAPFLHVNFRVWGLVGGLPCVPRRAQVRRPYIITPKSIVRCLESSKTFQHSACGGSKLWHVGLQLRGLICCMRGVGARRPTVARLLHLPVILTCRIPIPGLAVLV